MRKNWKDFFYFTKRERNGIIVLTVFLAGLFLGRYLWPFEKTPQELEVVLPDTLSTDSSFVEAPQQATTQPQRVQPQATARPKQPETRTYYPQKQPEVTPRSTYPRQEKYPSGTVIELNAADTTELKKIPGIGSSYARRIVNYRELLGGYTHPEQLQEVYAMYEELYDRIIPYLRIDTTGIVTLAVNRLSVDRLRRHPYLNFYQAKAIVETRQRKGRLKGVDDLILLEEFTPDDWARLRPYLRFED